MLSFFHARSCASLTPGYQALAPTGLLKEYILMIPSPLFPIPYSLFSFPYCLLTSYPSNP